MNVRPDRHNDHPWRLHVGVAGALGSIAGIVFGGCLALLLARVIGIDQSVADYGSAYVVILGGAWAGGLMGGVIVLRAARDPLTIPTIVCLGLLLAVPAVVAAYEGESGSGWPSSGRILLYGILYVLIPMASLPLAHFLAGSPGGHAEPSEWPAATVLWRWVGYEPASCDAHAGGNQADCPPGPAVIRVIRGPGGYLTCRRPPPADRAPVGAAQDAPVVENPDATEAERDLRELAGRLERINPDAAGSLREGLSEMFTVTRLGVRGKPLATVMSTNPVESMIEIVRDHARNLKHWQPGDMCLRWAAAGMLEAAKFRRIEGYSQLPQLASAIQKATAKTEDCPLSVTPAA